MFDLTEKPNRQARDLFHRWNLLPDGDPILTPTSLLLPVSRNGKPWMLKIATDPEEAAGMQVLAWWNGNGAVAVIERSHDAILMERPNGLRNLTAIDVGECDDDATLILCDVIEQLHVPDRQTCSTPLTSLEMWFVDLLAATPTDAMMAAGQLIANRLLQDQREIRVLHGDIHHGNVPYDDDRGWLAIDPKGLIGDRAFEYVNILRNPQTPLPTVLGRFARTIDVISGRAQIKRMRLLDWTLAFCCLSSVWLDNDDIDPILDLTIARLAAEELGLL